MVRVRVTLEKCIQDSQEYGSDDEHMVSRVFFSVEVDGRRSTGHVDIKQTVGSDYETGPIEVGTPAGYAGPFNQEVFQREVMEYFRGCIGSAASGIRLGPGAKNIRMRNNTFVRQHTFEFEAGAGGQAW
jgi:hypothetical protein